MTTQREHLIKRISRSIVWGQAEQYKRDHARSLAIRIVDDLFIGSAEGKATERAVRSISEKMEKSA